MRKVIFILMLSFSVFIFAYFLNKVEKSSSQIDKLDELLAPLLGNLENNNCLKYFSNLYSESDIVAVELYYNTQFVIAPTILTLDECDTELIVIDKSFPDTIKIDTNKIIGFAENEKFKTILLKQNIQK